MQTHFSDKTARAIAYAHEESRHMGYPTVCTWALLFGLQQVLPRHDAFKNLDRDSLRKAIDQTIQQLQGKLPEFLVLSDQVCVILEQARCLANQAKCPTITPENVLQRLLDYADDNDTVLKLLLNKANTLRKEAEDAFFAEQRKRQAARQQRVQNLTPGVTEKTVYEAKVLVNGNPNEFTLQSSSRAALENLLRLLEHTKGSVNTVTATPCMSGTHGVLTDKGFCKVISLSNNARPAA